MGLEAVNCEDLNSPKDKRGEDMILSLAQSPVAKVI